MRIEAIELPYFSVGAPAEITGPRVAQAGVGDRFGAVHRVEPSGHLVRRALVLHETVFTGRLDGLFVETHGIGVTPLEASDLCGHQGVFVGESRWAIFRPLAQLFLVRG